MPPAPAVAEKPLTPPAPEPTPPAVAATPPAPAPNTTFEQNRGPRPGFNLTRPQFPAATPAPTEKK